MQLLEFFAEFGTEEVRACTEDLPELDEGGSKVGEDHADAFVEGVLGEFGAFLVGEPSFCKFESELADRLREAVLAQNVDDVFEACGVAVELGDGGNLHRREPFFVGGLPGWGRKGKWEYVLFWARSVSVVGCAGEGGGINSRGVDAWGCDEGVWYLGWCVVAMGVA